MLVPGQAAGKVAAVAKRYWLFKTEPDVYSWEDLMAAKDRTTLWEGVRNYQARNILRDEVKLKDQVLWYHSRTNPQTIAGIATVVRTAYPDPTQFDPKSKYYDPKADPDDPRWACVDVQAWKVFRNEVTLPQLKERDDLEGLMLLKRGARLSVQPVSEEHWKIITKLGKPAPI